MKYVQPRRTVRLFLFPRRQNISQRQGIHPCSESTGPYLHDKILSVFAHLMDLPRPFRILLFILDLVIHTRLSKLWVNPLLKHPTAPKLDRSTDYAFRIAGDGSVGHYIHSSVLALALTD